MISFVRLANCKFFPLRCDLLVMPLGQLKCEMFTGLDGVLSHNSPAGRVTSCQAVAYYMCNYLSFIENAGGCERCYLQKMVGDARASVVFTSHVEVSLECQEVLQHCCCCVGALQLSACLLLVIEAAMKISVQFLLKIVLPVVRTGSYICTTEVGERCSVFAGIGCYI